MNSPSCLFGSSLCSRIPPLFVSRPSLCFPPSLFLCVQTLSGRESRDGPRGMRDRSVRCALLSLGAAYPTDTPPVLHAAVAHPTAVHPYVIAGERGRQEGTNPRPPPSPAPLLPPPAHLVVPSPYGCLPPPYPFHRCLLPFLPHLPLLLNDRPLALLVYVSRLTLLLLGGKAAGGLRKPDGRLAASAAG